MIKNQNLLILRRTQVQEITGLSRSSIYEKMKKGSFPEAIKLGERAVGWIEAEVLDWLQEQIKKSRGGSEL